MLGDKCDSLDITEPKRIDARRDTMYTVFKSNPNKSAVQAAVHRVHFISISFVAVGCN